MPHQFTGQEYADMIYVYGYCDGNSRAAAREYRRRYPARRVPNHQTFATTFQHLREHSKLPCLGVNRERGQDRAGPGRGRRDIEEEEQILNVINQNPKTSVRRITNASGVPTTSVWRIIHKEGLHPYHVQSVQRLIPGDEENRLIFCRWVLTHRPVLYRILFTDEATFTRDGIHNTRNDHVWSERNPRSVRQTHSQHRFSVNIWCGIFNNQLVGPHIIEGRLTGIQYLDFLQNRLPELFAEYHDRGTIFQHDGAPPHCSRQVVEFLNATFPNRWIGRRGPQEWPARSPDLNPLDYFLWGYLKSEVYSDEINTREELIARINQSCQRIRNQPDVIRKSVRTLSKRAQKCVEFNGTHFENLLHRN